MQLHVVPVDLIPREARLLLCTTPAGFPSPAADDLEEPIDLGSWLMEHPAASYVMRVDGHSMTDAGITDGDLIVVNRAVKPRAGHIVVALVHGDRTLKRLRRSERPAMAGRLMLKAMPAPWSTRVSRSGASSSGSPVATHDDADRAHRLQQLLRQLRARL